MGIYDREYMNRDKDKVRGNTNSQGVSSGGKGYCSNESGGGSSRKKKEENNYFHAGCAEHSKFQHTDTINAEYWDGEKWTTGKGAQFTGNNKPWVRPRLKAMFFATLVVFFVYKISNVPETSRGMVSQDGSENKTMETLEQDKRAGVDKSPYANMPKSPDYIRSREQIQKQGRGGTSETPVQALVQPPSMITDGNVTVLEGGKDGHYFSSGTVNGFPVVFMVDTGATTVSINEDTAARAGITRCTEGQYRTANGIAIGCKAIVPSITFGSYTVSNVEVVIMKSLSAHSLLGMNVLRLFKMQQQGNRLFLGPNT